MTRKVAASGRSQRAPMHADQTANTEHAELHDDERIMPAASELSDAIYALLVGKASIEGLCPNCLLGLAWLHTTARMILDHGEDPDELVARIRLIESDRDKDAAEEW